MIDTESRVKVADFGLARLTEPGSESWGTTMTGMVMGTPDYMAPEQKRGVHVDHRADIYSLGVMLYEMLCREVPQGIFEPPSKRVGCDPRIDQIVIRAMQQAPDRRYQSTQEMKTDLETARTPTVPESSTPSGTPPLKLAASPEAPNPAAPKPVGPHPSGGFDEAVHERIMAGLAKSIPQAPTGSGVESAREPIKPALPKLIPPPPRPRAKSRVPLYIGIVLALIGIIAGAYFFQKWKARKAEAKPAAISATSN
jgi:serine/threonine protein kinase